jgi:hypothetical protein
LPTIAAISGTPTGSRLSQSLAAATAIVEYAQTLPIQRHGVKDYFPAIASSSENPDKSLFIGFPREADLFSAHRTGGI